MILKAMEKGILCLRQWKHQLEIKDNSTEDLGYIPLSPVDDVDDEFYLDTLYWALKFRKQNDIKNIALTGSYGSGKSSVLKTFQKEYEKDKKFKFLNISLATFKEEDISDEEPEGTTDKGNTGHRSILSQIEVSILQQMFYHEKDKDIPDSRFKKIKSFNSSVLLLLSFYFILFIISCIKIFFPKFLNTTLNINDTPDWVSIASYAIFCLGLGYLIYKSIRVISAITIEKLKFQDAEIGFGNKTNKSILNHHLDEIFYFFEKGKYNVVIIEDLDRFKQTEIFTKLREINQLLNNSKKTKKLNITFIYAIRDEIFTDKERTKFFDFIIPIIPTVNSSNSGDFLQTLNTKKKLGLSESFIEDIAFYIDDRRLLHNVCNEFLIYKNKISGLLDNKLFALIAYKNVYPKDFARLGEHKGALYNAIQTKQEIVVKRNKDLNKEIEALKKERDQLTEVYVRNENDLRNIYTFKLITKLNNPAAFKKGDRTISFTELAEEEYFTYFQKNVLLYMSWQSHGYGSSHSQPQRIGVQFNEIEKEVNPQKSYEQSLKEIQQLKTGRLKQISHEINTREEQKLINRNKPIHELIKEDKDLLLIITEQVKAAEMNGKESPGFEDERLELIKKQNIITQLLRSGYVAEDYTHYISIFHKGVLTEKDNIFSSSVRNQDSLDFDFRLTNKENLVKRINVLNFKTDSILNYDLIDFLIEKKDQFQEQYQYMMEKLSDESPRSLAFIKGFLKASNNITAFIGEIVKYWPAIWRHFSQTDPLDKPELDELFLVLLKSAKASDLKNVSKDSDFVDRIENDSDFLNKIKEQKKIIEILKQLEIKLLDVNIDIAPDEVLNFVYEHNHYQINPQIIKKLIKHFGNFDPMNWEQSNYKAIQNSDCKPLVKYLNHQIQDYMDKIYFVIDANIEEEQSYYKKLLNNPNITLKSKLQLIKRIKTKLSHINQLEKQSEEQERNKELEEQILNENKLEPTWDSLLQLHKDNISWTSMVHFLNAENNAQLLGNEDIPITKGDNGQYMYRDFCHKIAISNEVEESSYDQILNVFPFKFDELEMSVLSESKVRSLIKHDILMVSSGNYEILKKHHINLLIFFIEYNTTEILEDFDEFDFTGEDLAKVLNSSNITASNKNQFINEIEEERIFDAPQNIQLILSFLDQNPSLEINNLLLYRLLLSSHGTIQMRIKVFNARHQFMDQAAMVRFLDTLPNDFKEIPNPNRRIAIPYSLENEALLNLLRSEGIINNYTKKENKLRVSHKKN